MIELVQDYSRKIYNFVNDFLTQEAIYTFIIGIIITFYKKIFKMFNFNKSKDAIFIENLEYHQTMLTEFNKKIVDVLYAHKETTNLANIVYFEFHNGGKNHFGLSYLKFSERVQFPRIEKLPYLKVKDEYIAEISHIVSLLKNKNDIVILKEDSKTVENLFFKQKLEEMNSEKCIIYPFFYKELLLSFVVVFIDSKTKNYDNYKSLELKLTLSHVINNFYETFDFKRKIA